MNTDIFHFSNLADALISGSLAMRAFEQVLFYSVISENILSHCDNKNNKQSMLDKLKGIDLYKEINITVNI